MGSMNPQMMAGGGAPQDQEKVGWLCVHYGLLRKIITLLRFVIIPPPQNVWGGYTGFPSRRSVGPSPIRVRSITPLLMEGFPSNLHDTFTSTRGCTEPMLPMCQLKVKVTVKGQIFHKQILHVMSCPLNNSFTNGRISFKLE